MSYSIGKKGLSCRKEDLENAPSLKECIEQIRNILPHDCTLVGQGINHGIYS